MQLKICRKCRRPFLAHKENCPHCPEPVAWNQAPRGNLGCLLSMLLPFLLLVAFWLFFFVSFYFR